MSLEQVFSSETVIMNLESTEKNELFKEMIASVAKVQKHLDCEQALQAVLKRESKMSTGIMHDVAVPHGSCPSVKDVVGAIGISRRGIEYESLDKAPVHLVFMLLCSPSSTDAHLAVLKDLASVLQNPEFVKEIQSAKTSEEVYSLLGKYSVQSS